MSRIAVAAERPYQVVIEPGASRYLNEHLAGCGKVALLYPAVLAARAISLANQLDADVLLLTLPDAENAKSVEVVVDCWHELAEAGFTRGDAVVGIGGGATTDVAGFIASTWLRGVRYLSVPTTLLGMVDAAVGGKTGINIPQGKNLVGTFYEPAAVLCDLDFLRTLPDAEIRSGLAETIKCGFIADPRILQIVEADPRAALRTGTGSQAELIHRAIAVKAAVVSADLREAMSGTNRVGREQLNYGHTLAHAIEHREQYRMRHGDAVSIGMCFAARLAQVLGHLDAPTAARHATILGSVGLPTSYDRDAWPELRDSMNLDKKTRGATLRFVGLHGIGNPVMMVGPTEEQLTAAYLSM